MPRVVHFDISFDNADRAIQFYNQVFGWKIEKWDGPIEYWLVSAGEESEPGIDGGLMKREDPSHTTINTIEVPSLDEYVAKIANQGGEVIRPKMAIPGVGYFALCQDTEGNPFGIMESDEGAQ